MSNSIYSILAAIIVSFVSFTGIFILVDKIAKSKSVVTALISFAAGTLIGDVFLHLLPEQIEVNGFGNDITFGIFAGIIIMIIVEAYFHCSHDSAKEVEEHHSHNHSLAKLNIFGDAIHNFLDGIAIAASFLVNVEAGIATTLAVALHEIPQEIADVSVLAYSGWSKTKIMLVNFITALTSVLGVIFVLLLSNSVESIEKYLISFAIGQFIYISMADLLPEIHKKSNVKKYFIEISMFTLGIVLMYLLTLVE
jgi:zinc and cadmium transporter